MATATQTVYVSLGGITINGTIQRTGAGQFSQQITPATFPAGNAGTLTTRTDDNTGVATLAAEHTIQSNDLVSVWWAGGWRYNMVATVAATLVTLEGGAGDVLPAQATALVVSKLVELGTDFAGSELEVIAAKSDAPAILLFMDVNDAVLLAVELAADEPWIWTSGGEITNPLAGETVSYLLVGNGDPTASTFSLGGLYDSLT